MSTAAASIERLLRDGPREMPSLRACIAIGATGSAVLGAAMGAGSGEPLLALYAALKVPLLLAVTTMASLPNFYVVNTLLGLRDDFAAACRGLIAAQAALGIALAALAPLCVFASVCFVDPYLLTNLDGVWFLLATIAAQRVLARHYAPLIARDRRHRRALACWFVLYVFIAIQMAWVLRPFRGTEGFPVAFLRPTAFEQNAYLVLLAHLQRMFGG